MVVMQLGISGAKASPYFLHPLAPSLSLCLELMRVSKRMSLFSSIPPGKTNSKVLMWTRQLNLTPGASTR